MTNQPIAIIGMACQFPGADNLSAYWQLIKNNHIATRTEAPDALPADFCRRHLAGGFINHVDMFDADFFGFSHREADLMDPQQRLLLQNVWHAIENAGLDPQQLRGSKTGVFIGAMANDWAARTLRPEPELNSQMITGNGLALLANRISYIYDFKGPSLSIDTACSSSLVAMHSAIQSLALQECDYAIVAGVNIIATPVLQQFYQRAGIGSKQGQCQPFSQYSEGIVRGEGVGVVLLQRDSIHADSYATILGCSLNHNGQSNGLTAPSRFAQQALLTQTYQKIGVSPDMIDYVECHGTGTLLGDHIELQALQNILQVSQRQKPCHIGSVKGLIGHTEAASGIAGLIKLALMSYHGHVPASLYHATPNPLLNKIDAVALPPLGYDLSPHQQHHFALSSFGLGGTNAHLVLRQVSPRHGEITPLRPQLFTLSAPTLAALTEQSLALYDSLNSPMTEMAWQQMACQSRQVKSQFAVRKAWVANSPHHLQQQIQAFLQQPQGMPCQQQRLIILLATDKRPRNLIREIDQQQGEPVTQSLQHGINLFLSHIDPALLKRVVATETEVSSLPVSIHLFSAFCWDYATTKSWLSMGIKADHIIAQGLGEYSAACLCGLLSLTEATHLLALHADIVDKQQAGTATQQDYEKFQCYYQTLRGRQINDGYFSCHLNTTLTTLPLAEQWLALPLTEAANTQQLATIFPQYQPTIVLSNQPEITAVSPAIWISEPHSDIDALQQHLYTIGQLYESGLTLSMPTDLVPVRQSPLPEYQFQKRRYWPDTITMTEPTSVDIPQAHNETQDSLSDSRQWVLQTLSAALGNEIQDLTGNQRLSADLGLDSIVVIELIDEFNRYLPTKHQLSFTDTINIVTVDDLIQRVTSLQAQGN